MPAYSALARRLLRFAPMDFPSALTARHALFLDFDGTLVDIAAQPGDVQVPPALAGMLQRLHTHLQGALAIVTGRTDRDIDQLLEPLQLPLASEHGAQYRLGNGHAGGVPRPDLAPLLETLRPLLAKHPTLLLEPKRAGLALHYRQAPALEALCRDTLRRALPAVPGLELLEGKCVLEVKPIGPSKGQAIRDFMRHAPFAGRIPLFVGDDVTDEAGFAAVQALGGTGVKVGAGPTAAMRRFADVAAVRAWLAQQSTAPMPPTTAGGMP